MAGKFPEIYLVRHGETEWSATGKHTGRSDIPLTAAGEDAARSLAERLRAHAFSTVWSSPSSRAWQTCVLSGYGGNAVKKDDLQEWDYGDYEGLTTKQITAERPGWSLYSDGCPGGESVAEAGERANRVVAALRRLEGTTLIFSSSHFLRTLASCWLGLGPEGGRHFVLDTASVSILGYEHDMTEPVIRRWNQRG